MLLGTAFILFVLPSVPIVGHSQQLASFSQQVYAAELLLPILTACHINSNPSQLATITKPLDSDGKGDWFGCIVSR